MISRIGLSAYPSVSLPKLTSGAGSSSMINSPTAITGEPSGATAQASSPEMPHPDQSGDDAGHAGPAAGDHIAGAVGAHMHGAILRLLGNYPAIRRLTARERFRRCLAYGGRMRLRCTSLLPCSVERLAAELTRSALLNHVSWPMLVFVGLDPDPLPERFTARRYLTRLLIGGRLSIGEHTLQRSCRTRIGAQDDSGLVWHDAGYSPLIKVWDHKIRLADFHGMTRYTDEVEVQAGPLTIAAWLFASAFYRHRQRRLSRLVAAGFAYAP